MAKNVRNKFVERLLRVDLCDGSALEQGYALARVVEVKMRLVMLMELILNSNFRLDGGVDEIFYGDS